MSIRHWTRLSAAFYVLLAFATVLAAVASADSNPAVTTREDFDVVTTNPCTGEPVRYSGTIHWTIRSFVDFQKGVARADVTGNLQHATIVGLESGDAYIATGQPFHETFMARLLGPETDDEEDDTAITVNTIVNREMYIAPGDGPVVQSRSMSHIVYFEYGPEGELDIKIFRDEVVLECGA